MSKKFHGQHAKPSKIQVEVKNIRPTSLNKNLASELNFDRDDDADYKSDADGSDR